MSFSFSFVAANRTDAAKLIRKEYAPELVKAAVISALNALPDRPGVAVEVTGSGHLAHDPGDTCAYQQNVTLTVRPLVTATP